MKIEIRFEEGEKWESPIAFAEAVIRHYMDDATDPETALTAVEALDEIECYLRVFTAHHPACKYEEMANGKA